MGEETQQGSPKVASRHVAASDPYPPPLSRKVPFYFAVCFMRGSLEAIQLVSENRDEKNSSSRIIKM